jgi:hypothetical protein
MATERDFELLDDYLANRLTGPDKTTFETRLQADPDLSSEFQLQSRLVKGIKDARIAELKAILNNTPIPPLPHGGTALVGKLAVGTFVAGLVATGIYFYTDKTETITPAETVIEQQTPADTQITDSTPVAEQDTETTATEPIAETKVEEPKKDSEKRKSTRKQTTQPAEQPVLDVYDPADEGVADNGETDVEEPAGERTNPVKAGAPAIAVEVDRENKKYNFHYQFKDGQLYLFGPFEKNLYEIMEFFSEDKRTVFLYYKEGYYLLEENNEKVKSLKLISDPELIKKLKEYRQN